ncbi:hypothetical protein [Antiquaquibacter soli]|uniref:Metal-independent alpha-mannosidase n=1 Tax=Antiquaquibacter soli TaxID=3064523 RepID=A0ABT9BV65_9MICO|nr:hypothetical protein [Protaetiibacter sp. WY-16]MDO7883300.1 hypothetical protein [Protaetiibacter sp. WY-16]
MSESLTTFAPIETPESLHPTGSLLVALPEIDDRGWCRSINIAHEGQRGLVAAHSDSALIRPVVTVDGVEASPGLEWRRLGHWVPSARGSDERGELGLAYLAPVAEQGVVARVEWTNTTGSPQEVALAFTGEWSAVQVHHFKAKRLSVGLRERDDEWTGARTVYAGADRLLLSISWRAGEGAAHGGHPAHGWLTERSGTLEPGDSLSLEVFIGVATEPDGSGATALHLRRRGADALLAGTLDWLDARSLGTGDDALDARLNENLFFSYFFAQADCLDSGRAVMLTSRSPRYYVSGAFWSRDAYWWTFPAILLADPARARRVLVESIASAGSDIAHHALYITGQRLYPGFELDELTAPLLAIWRYTDSTGDRSVLREPAIAAFLDHYRAELAEWFDADLGLYGTFLLPTDDPTDFPFVTTDNATVAVGFRILAAFDESPTAAARLLDRALSVELALVDRAITADGRWAWAIDSSGAHELREEPPLGLRLLDYFGVVDAPARAATERWLVTDYEYHFGGAYPGAGAPHFASPSSFDLGNRMLTANADLGDPVEQFVAAPLDNGLGCESWDPLTGQVVTGAAMASVAGFLAWTAWANRTGHRRWNDPFGSGAQGGPR